MKEECTDSGGLATKGLTGDEDGGVMEAEQSTQSMQGNKLPPDTSESKKPEVSKSIQLTHTAHCEHLHRSNAVLDST